jgi:Putative beta-barrel porin 2
VLGPEGRTASLRWPAAAAATLILSGILPILASAQDANPPGPETPPTDPSAAAPPPETRPGKYRIGALYVTPGLAIGPIGFDTNVLYSPTEHQPDFIVQAGPTLDLVLPLGRHGRLYGNGTMEYLWFARTASQRRWNASAFAGLGVRGGRTEATIEERYAQTFSRPNYEVNDRILQIAEGTRAEVTGRILGRLILTVRGNRLDSQTDQGQDYLGTDLGLALTQLDYQAGGELSYGVTVKTSLVILGGYQWNRYQLEPVRDSDFRLAAGGIKTDLTALISGQALVGRQWYLPRSSEAQDRQITWVNVSATLNVSPRTQFGGGYTRNLLDSIFLTANGQITSSIIETAVLRLQKDLGHRVDLRIFAQRTRQETLDPVTIVVPGEGPVTQVRSDIIREAGADLGYTFRPKFRMGIVATYTDRDSTYSYFGIQGLLVGFNAQFNPN